MLYSKYGDRVVVDGPAPRVCIEMIRLIKAMHECLANDVGKEEADAVLVGIGRAAVNEKTTPEEAFAEFECLIKEKQKNDNGI